MQRFNGRSGSTMRLTVNITRGSVCLLRLLVRIAHRWRAAQHKKAGWAYRIMLLRDACAKMQGDLQPGAWKNTAMKKEIFGEIPPGKRFKNPSNYV